MTKIDISSTAVEKSIDGIGSFIGKIINPPAEEVGLFLKEHVSMWRFNRQVKMLKKANDICERQNINPKAISLKLLTPLIEYSSIEENDYLLDKWATLLSNLVDSEQNIENHVFPYLLSQISIKEFILIEETYENKQERNVKIKLEYEDTEQIKELQNKLNNTITEIERYNDKSQNDKQLSELILERQRIEKAIKTQEIYKTIYPQRLKESQIIEANQLAGYELYNLIRLGLVRERREYYSEPQKIEIPKNTSKFLPTTTVKVEFNMNSDTQYFLTDLGEVFISVCKEKRKD